jgi:hypothetical protein
MHIYRYNVLGTLILFTPHHPLLSRTPATGAPPPRQQTVSLLQSTLAILKGVLSVVPLTELRLICTRLATKHLAGPQAGLRNS